MLDYMLAPLKKYAQFTGRSRRAEFWWYILAVWVISFVLSLFGGHTTTIHGFPMHQGGPLSMIFALATFIPSLAVAFRRLHDTNRTAWWILIGIIPIIGWIVLLVFYVQDGTAGANKYGDDPKGRSEPAVSETFS